MTDDSALDSKPAGTKESDDPLDAPEGPAPDAADEELGDVADGDEDLDDNGKGEEDGDGQEDGDGEPASKDAIQESARAHLINQTHPIVLPSYSSWFDMDAIHQNEKRALPEFFNSRNRSKTPAVYKDYRDFMVNTYRLNPEEYLTFTACRRNLAGDVCGILRVHSFLEQWGLINYQVCTCDCLGSPVRVLTELQVDPEARPSAIAPPFTGHFRIIADTPRGLQPYQPSKDAKLADTADPKAKKLVEMQPAFSASTMSMTGRRNIYDSAGKDITPAGAEGKDGISNGENAKELEEQLKEPDHQHFCNSCGMDCTREYWHNARSAPAAAAGKTAALTKYDVCAECHREGHFPSASSKEDFVKVENPYYKRFPDKDRAWSDVENLRLLEGLELFDDEWNDIAKHVGSRTREQCILRFLQLEIEDNYVAAESTADGSKPDLSYLSGGGIPFSQASNPVMSVVGFLAGAVDAGVAAAAAGRSVQEMKKSMADAAGTSVEEIRRKAAEQKGQSADAVKAEDAMDVSDARGAPNSAATTALALAAARSAALATHEERHMSSLLSRAASLQLQKMELKLQQFAEMEALMQAERRDLERRRRELFLERLAWRGRCDATRSAVEDAARRGVQTPEGLKGVMDALAALGIGAEGLALKEAGEGDVVMEGDAAMAVPEGGRAFEV